MDGENLRGHIALRQPPHLPLRNHLNDLVRSGEWNVRRSCPFRRAQRKTADETRTGENATASDSHFERFDARTIGLGRMYVRRHRVAAPAEISHTQAAAR